MAWRLVVPFQVVLTGPWELLLVVLLVVLPLVLLLLAAMVPCAIVIAIASVKC